jgi:predicted DsbA family dithiol-disulfide isomerase
MAIEFERVRADVVEANEFPDLARAYGVTGVPKVVINDRVEFTGAVPEARFIEAIQRAVPTPPASS